MVWNLSESYLTHTSAIVTGTISCNYTKQKGRLHMYTLFVFTQSGILH